MAFRQAVVESFARLRSVSRHADFHTHPLQPTQSSSTHNYIHSSLAAFSSSSGTQTLFSESNSSTQVDPVAAEAAGASPVRQSLLWRTVKLLVGSSVTIATVGGAYVTYAYSTHNLNQELTSVKSYLNDISTLETADPIQKFVSGVQKASVEAFVQLADAYLDARQQIEEQIQGFAAPSSDRLLPDQLPQEQNVLTLVLDLNDTLVHSEWKRERGWRTFKRPGVDAFLEHMAHSFEVVVFSDQVSFTVDPILNRLDPQGFVRYRLYRDGTEYKKGEYYKDLSKLNRDPRKVLYLTGHPETCYQQENVVRVPAWTVSDTEDTSLLALIPFLEYVARHRPADVRTVMASYEGKDIPSEFKERTKIVMKKQQERKQQGGLLRLVRPS